ncbi:MAG: F0F1 ATP synthase subunit B [Lachnospiraceae bacterium]|jgi:F-type H+-transporting ATPase subunit b|nr:F0F1 ATP synthase subunit B [Lachnospiraceae bacterium]MCR4803568.1 F0F1 ATP synthase subunit B [Lachnospiraceae bacterium]
MNFAMMAVDAKTPNILTMDLGILWTVLNIAIMAVFFKIFLFDKVNKVLDARQKLIGDNIAEAEKSKEEAAALKHEYEVKLNEADKESVEIIKEAKERAQIEYNKKVEESHTEAARIMDEANRSIELQKKKSMEQAQSEIAGIALLAAQKVIQKNVDAEDNKKLIGDFLQEAGGSE